MLQPDLRELHCSEEGVRGQHDGISVVVCVLYHDLVSLLQEPHATRVTGVRFGGGTGGVSHGGAGQPGDVVDQDLKGVHLVVIQIVYLGVDEVDARGSDPDSSVIDRELLLHLHPPGPPGDRPVPEHSVPQPHPAAPLCGLGRVPLQVYGRHLSGRAPLLARPAPDGHPVPGAPLSQRGRSLLLGKTDGAHVGIERGGGGGEGWCCCC